MDSFKLPSACICRYRSSPFGLRQGQQKSILKPACSPYDLTQKLDVAKTEMSTIHPTDRYQKVVR